MRLQRSFVLALPRIPRDQLPTTFSVPFYTWITVPLISSLVAFVLIVVTLSSGTGSHSQQQQLEQYHIFAVHLTTSVRSLLQRDPVAINSSTLYRDLSSWVDDLRDDASSQIDDFQDDASSQIDGLRNNASSWVDGLRDDSDRLVLQWYSIHLRSYCQGSFLNDTRSVTLWNVTRCVNLDSDDPPSHPETLGRLYEKISRYLFGTMLVYAISAALCLLSDILGLVAWVLYRKYKPWQYRRIVVVHMVVAFFAFVFIFSGTVVVTVTTSETASIVENLTGIGITVDSGSSFLSISWAASLLTLLSCLVLIPFYRYWYRVIFARLD